MEKRKAIPYHKTGTTDGAWDAGANEGRIANDAGEAVLRQMYAWVDPEADADTKSAYKFPHHQVDGEGHVGDANLVACSAGIAALNGGRGGTSIPEADRQGVYDHLAHHLRDAGKEPPELKSRGAAGQVEHRAWPLRGVEVRAGDDGKPRLRGHASVFDQVAEIGGWFGGFKEVVRKGAFAKTINEADVRALWNHDPNWVLGRNKAGTLTLSEDDRGLAIDNNPPDTQWARDLMTTIQRGDVDQMSFGFQVVREAWDHDTDTRELLEVKLFDVSVVTYPAYEGTDVGVRSAFAAAGVDWDGLARALALSQRGQPFDRGIVAASVEALSACLAGAPGEIPHPPVVRGVPLEVLRRRLELAERAL